MKQAVRSAVASPTKVLFWTTELKKNVTLMASEAAAQDAIGSIDGCGSQR